MTFDGEKDVSQIRLPAREAEILGLAAKGLTDKQISAELGISRDTVSTYWRRILLRYKAANRTEVVARAVEQELSKKVDAAERLSERLMAEIHERSEAQARDLANRNLLVAVQSALLSFVSGSPKPHAIFADLLSELVSATESEFGFIADLALTKSGEITMRNLALTNIAWDDESRNRYATELTTQFLPINNDNLVGAVISSREPLIVNDVAHDPRSGGVPDGHKPLDSFLGIPIFNGHDMVGMVGVSNRPGGYQRYMIEDLMPLIATCGALISGLKMEEKRQVAEEDVRYNLARLNALLHGLDSPVILVDNRSIMRFANESFCREFMPGLKPEEAVGLVARQLMNDYVDEFADPKGYIERVNEILAAAKPIQGELILLKDGRRFLRDFDPLWQGNEYLGHVWKFTRIP